MGKFSLYIFNRALIMTITDPRASVNTCKNTALMFKLASLAIKYLKNHKIFNKIEK
jgi:hypothetical protein